LALKLTVVSNKCPRSLSGWLDDMARKPKAAGADLVWTPQRAHLVRITASIASDRSNDAVDEK